MTNNLLKNDKLAMTIGDSGLELILQGNILF